MSPVIACSTYVKFELSLSDLRVLYYVLGKFIVDGSQDADLKQDIRLLRLHIVSTVGSSLLD